MGSHGTERVSGYNRARLPQIASQYLDDPNGDSTPGQFKELKSTSRNTSQSGDKSWQPPAGNFVPSWLGPEPTAPSGGPLVFLKIQEKPLSQSKGPKPRE